MAQGDLYRVAIKCRVHGQLNVNTLHLKQDGFNGDTAADAAEHLLPRLAPIWQRSMGIADFSRQWEMDVVKVDSIVQDMGSWAVEIPSAGQAFNGALPSTNAVVISLGTGLVGADRRGRIFLGGVAQTHVLNSVLNPTGVGVYGTFITEAGAELQGATPASGFRLGVYSRKRAAILGNPFDDTWKPVTQMTVRTIIATMRSRKIGIGS